MFGMMGLLGWILDIEILKSFLPGLTTMKANTALGFISAGAASGLLLPSSRPAALPACRAVALGVLLLGLLTLLEYLLGVDLGIDQLLFEDHGYPYPGRMAPATAVGFVVLGAAILQASRRRSRSCQWLSILLLMHSMVALAGYLFDVSALYQVVPYTSVALHTALAFHLLALSVLASSPDLPLVRIFLADTAGGITARRLLPLIPAVICLLGWISVRFIHAGMFKPSFAIGVLVVLCVFFASGLVAWHARVLNRIDLIRKGREAEIESLNAGLEQKVEARTRELREALDRVRKLEGLIPICAWCKRVRIDPKYWESLETYLTEHTDTRFTHAICPDCLGAVLSGARIAPEPGWEGEIRRLPEHGSPP